MIRKDVGDVMMSEKTLMSLHDDPAVKAVYSWLDDQHMPMIDCVERWASINSGSLNIAGLAEMQQELISAFTILDCEQEIIDLPDSEYIDASGATRHRKNAKLLRFFKRPTANKKVLLTGHYDTVFGVDHPFQSFCWLDGDIINGPGVADMKGGIIIILNALMALERSPFADTLGWEVLLSPDEETGSLASAHYLVKRAPDFDIGLTYEPAMADGTLVGERKGSGNYTVVVKGRAAHAGREIDLGRNAVVALADIIGKLSALNGVRQGLTVNPAVIEGGKANNIVPDLAICRFNVRLENSDDVTWLDNALRKIIEPWNDKEGYSVTRHGGINRPPKVLSKANQELMALIKTCGELQALKVEYVATGGCCEGNNLAAAGLPNVDTLGVRGGAIHSAEEFLHTESMVERAKLSSLILMAISGGYFDTVINLKSDDVRDKGIKS